MTLSDQLDQCRAALAACGARPAGAGAAVLFFSVSDGEHRAEVLHTVGVSFDAAWLAGVQRLRQRWGAALAGRKPLWLRVDAVERVQQLAWTHFKAQLKLTKRNYFRCGLALDAGFQEAYTEQELNANGMLYGGNEVEHAMVNPRNFGRYARRRFNRDPDVAQFAPERPVVLFSTRGVYCGPQERAAMALAASGMEIGRRVTAPMTARDAYALVASGARYLARQVLPQGRFAYGWFPCFGRPISGYNGLRHASSLYSMVEAWELTHDQELMEAIDRALACLTETLIQVRTLPDGQRAAFLIDVGDEIKLGGNAACVFALARYCEATGTRHLLPLLEQLAVGMLHMQDPAMGRFVHVLNAGDLSVKQEFRVIYYDGEAAFGLMRLYGLTRDPRWLAAVERAFDYFIAKEHWRAHDHWLSYCVNELTLYRPEERYFRFGIRNVADHLDFVLARQTTFPTLLELMMAAQQMIARLGTMPALQHVLAGLDMEKFLRALHHRANYLLNGFFWPELAMYFEKPSRVVGAFFIRHHAFRVRIDDVEHYVSGLAAYGRFLQSQSQPSSERVPDTAAAPCPAPEAPARARVVWGGDVNLGRRLHFRLRELGGARQMLGHLAVLREADMRIVNLECVVATEGEQGVQKDESGPYYYRARPEMLAVLTEAAIDVVTTANNHSGDYGPRALMEQRTLLEAAGIGQTGSGRSWDEACTPVLRVAGGVRVAVFSFDATQPRFAAGPDHPGIAWLSPDDPAAWCKALAPRIAAARRQAHVVLVAVHWGENLATAPAPQTVALGHSIIDAGADAVLGASAHVVQGIEIYRGRPILYDAGDLLFESVRSGLADGGVFTLELTPQGVEAVVFTPIGVGYGFSQALEGDRARAAASEFAGKCLALGTVVSLLPGGRCAVALTPPARPVPITVGPAPVCIAPMAQRPAARHPEPCKAARPEWRVAQVPEHARMDPIQVGPLRLLGLRCSPEQLKRRGMLWIESFWSSDAKLQQDLRLQFRAVPARSRSMPAWGEGMDHDPCDWMWPTSRWEPGTIYRDFYGLRPPPASLLESDVLRLEVRVVGPGVSAAPVLLPLWHGLRVPAPAAPAAVPAAARRDPPGHTWTAEQLRQATGGRWLVEPPAGWHARSVVRGPSHIAMLPGPTLFVASDYRALAAHEAYSRPKALTWDRHRDLPKLQDQLAGAIVARPVEGLDASFPLLQVEDPIAALIALGLTARQRFQGKVAAVTGTAGKSSTVAILRTILPEHSRVLSTIDNYNSRVGVPAMLASLAANDDACILEMAQSSLWMNSGPISLKARPHVAILTEVDLSQTGTAATLERTAEFKSRIFLGLEPGGTAVFGEHLPHFELVKRAALRTAGQLLVVGTSPQASLRLVDVQPQGGGYRVRLSLQGRALAYDLPIPSMAMVRNSAMALAAAHAMGHDAEAACARMPLVRTPPSVLERLEVCTRRGIRATVIDDSWNAEVLSMRNAMDYARRYEEHSGQRVNRKIAILGRIVNLGDDAAALHRGLARPLLDSGIQHLVTHGAEMRWLREEMPAETLGPHFDSAPDLVRYVEGFIRDGDLVLVKGDRVDSDFGDIAGLLQRL
ncbi:CapA family protein [Xylophilus sp. ASV27]|uniref:CapA family protein n=1 Tax=Xylophilus sp. ASV27 TaxID=2795129 RepID=UPI0018EA6AEF|nr:CapA family protein [Xylophilus sp. ASV27]